jgi:hypothetical protein
MVAVSDAGAERSRAGDVLDRVVAAARDRAPARIERGAVALLQ